ncbi:TIGR04283 family arsenosugar biosynthesis glycosyltransferase [Longimicrobium terrae]|uniref:RSAM/selenodomain-associated transferase 2 n=1 Tax=Longimicrobium terrae TaxID=1639882 RepID=A0A841GYE2_9BACT|nr:rSAM/selenodomain-associated transferase 2 [Longimicrobium terrae]MBB6070780.1 rSAM/selenodomain-associated transferase 2 [Longimicrobium terrae]NNC29760.1 glycosyltransferase family 2 protein [Longimicrobium terrae]
MTAPPRISIIIPALNEAEGIADTLAALAPLRARGHQVIVADGGSADATVELARPLADAIVDAPRGRALQQNAGAAAADGDVLLFLHADTRLPPDADRLVLDGLAAGGAGWGRFDVRLTGGAPMLRVVERMISLRSRATGIATGDQAIFVRRDWWERAGGFPPIPLMEDVALSTTLRRRGRPLCLRAAVTTSSRRWEQRGVWRTILLMWRLRMEYALGADPERLAARYR